MEQDAAAQLPLKPRDDYQPVDRIGRGAFGDVFLCQHRVRGDRVCVKEVDLQLLSPVERRGCLEEVAVLRRLPRHPHIVSLLDAFRDQASPNLLLLVLEFADAGDLAQLLLDAADGASGESRPQYRQQALQLFAQIVEGVAFLHARNVLHRDLKPQNVFLFHSTEQNTDTLTGFRAVVGDFGSSKTLSSSTALAQTVVGSPLYMSPELLESEPHGPPTDVWSLGCLLYELLAGQPPFRAPSYPAVVRKITRGEYVPLTIEQTGDDKVRDLVSVMLQRDPSKRPTAADLLKSPALAPYAACDGDVKELPASDIAESSAPSLSETASTEQLTTTGLASDDHNESLGLTGTEVNEADSAAAMPPPAPVLLPTTQQPTRPSPPLANGTAGSNSTHTPALGDDLALSEPPDRQPTSAMPLPTDRHVPSQQQRQKQVQRYHQHHVSRSHAQESFPLPPPPQPASTRAPALRPSFLPKSAQRASSAPLAVTKAPPTATFKPKNKPISDSSAGNISSGSSRVRTATTASELLVVGVRVTSKRPPATATTTKSLHGR